MITRQNIMRIVMLSLIFVSNLCFADGIGYILGGSPVPGGQIAKGTSVPICNQPDANKAVNWYLHLRRWNTRRGSWEIGPTYPAHANGAGTGQPWNNASTIDPKMILDSRDCNQEGYILFGVPIPEAINFSVDDDPEHAGDICLVFNGDNTDKDTEEWVNEVCDISPGRPKLECHVVPSELHWDLGALTPDELAKKSIDLYLSTECENPNQDSVKVNIEVTSNEINNVEMAFTSSITGKSLGGDYTLTPGTQVPIKITFTGMPSAIGGMTFTSIMKITYL